MSKRFLTLPDLRPSTSTLHGILDTDNGQYIASGTVGAMICLATILNGPDVDVAAWRPFEYGPQTLLIPCGERMSLSLRGKLETVVASVFGAIERAIKDEEETNAD